MGRGVYAQRPIAQGTIIGDYLGTIIKTQEYDLESDKKGLYLMYLTDETSVYPDLTQPGIHLLNHSCEPNCWMYIHEGHTLFFAISDIAPGTQLTISYLLSPREDGCTNCTHQCYCQSAKCTGTMHLSRAKYALWQRFQNAKKKNQKPLKVTIGEQLAPLRNYPLRLPVDPIYQKITSS